MPEHAAISTGAAQVMNHVGMAVFILYSSLKFKVAEQWCSLGMRFLKHLTQHKASYEKQVCIKPCKNSQIIFWFLDD